MDKTIISIIGAVSALATLDVACASAAVSPGPAPTMEARSFGDLLEPIPNAATMLRAIDAAGGAQPNIQLAQYDQYHHHHHHYRPPPRHYYYHHHHHHNYYHPPRYHHHQQYRDQPSYDHEGY